MIESSSANSRRALLVWLASASALTALGPRGAQAGTPVRRYPLACEGPETSSQSYGLYNTWPDPQLCIQDADAIVTALDDTLSGPMPPVTVSFFSGALNLPFANILVTCLTNDTSRLVAGSTMLAFRPPAPASLTSTLLRVLSVKANASFTVMLEYPSCQSLSELGASVVCTADIVQKGQVASMSGDITSNLSRQSRRTLGNAYITDRPAITGQFRGAWRALVYVKATDAPEQIFTASWYIDQIVARGTTQAHGCACAVVSGSGASVTPFVNDGTFHYGAQRATSSARTWISMAHTISRTASTLWHGFEMAGPAGSTIIFAEFTKAQSGGAALPDGAFSTPRGQFVRSKVSISPWNGTSFRSNSSFAGQGSGFIMDIRQASGGTLNDGVSTFQGLVEANSTSPGAFITSSSGPGASLYNPILFMSSSLSPSAFASGVWNLDDSRYPYLYWYGTANAAFTAVSFDIHGATLFTGP